ncbi:uncharacterized protein LOC34618618 [Cyclospora cayetanensis]|uniref:Uncharacterized protein n=2 Tax=Cyclospora cayetanensis TaxID=88456 RepID=A0A1D3D239_9EIME|nr:uncharacterized protein LOC34618618 [Cyclospora cayetanensis]OEH77506.1 hypothetical protein cyc_01643 [Cyclospora cayetanensis]
MPHSRDLAGDRAGEQVEPKPCFCSCPRCIPCFMFFLTFGVGLSCLFFMTTGGLVLCILHCSLGCFLVLIPCGARKSPELLCAIVALISNLAYLALVLSTLAYAVYLLGLNSLAEDARSRTTGSPLHEALLDLYARQGQLETSGSDDSAEGPMEEQSQGFSSGEPPMSTVLLTFKTVPSIAIPSTLEPDLRKLVEQALPQSKPLLSKSNSAKAAGEQMLNISHTIADTLKYAPSHPYLQPSIGFSGDQLISPAQQHFGKFLPKEPPSTSAELPVRSHRAFWFPQFTRGDLNCLEKMQSGTGEVSGAMLRAHVLMDWGLFCGYTQYSVGVLRKWPVSCKADCLFDKLQFSGYEKQAGEAEDQGALFVVEVNTMSREQALQCTALAVATACRIEEHHLQYGAIGALAVALLGCISLFGCGLYRLSESTANIMQAKRKVPSRR